MNANDTLPDRLARAALRLLAAANLIFVSSLVLALLFAADRANAEQITCEGENLLESLAQENPRLVEQIDR